MLIVLERECLELKEEIELLTERQELLATPTEGKMSKQKVALEKYQKKIFEELKELQGQKTKEALELLGRQHKLVNSENERDRARMIQGIELSGAVGNFSGALDSSSLDCCSPSVAQDADDAMSQLFWTSLAKGKERDWWSVDLEGDKEKLEVAGCLSRTEGRSVDPKGKVGHWSARRNARLRAGDFGEMGFVPSASSEPRGAFYWC